MRNIPRSFTIILMLAAVVHARTTLTGKWEGTSPSGSQILFEVKASGDVLTGTLAVDGHTFTISDGKVSKNVSFPVK